MRRAVQVAETEAARAVDAISVALAPGEVGQHVRFKAGKTVMTWKDMRASVRRRIICAHEAGHALMAAHDSAPFPSVKVARSCDFGIVDGNLIADIVGSLDDVPPQLAELVYLSTIRIALAGGVAELLFLKEEFAAREIGDDGQGIKWFTFGAGHDMRTAIGLAHFIFPSELNKAVNALRRCRRDVTRLFASQAGISSLRATVEALDSRGKLSGDEVGRLLCRAQARSSRRGRPAKAR